MNHSLLRFITAGSVDDGKSTLIGRLLYDSKTLMSDQLSSLTVGETPDFASLTDGLEAEREQGITIDVAYRYFATPKRKFIVADTPGHEQYTRNMVTGASTADAAIVLVDASRVNFSEQGAELLVQTKRHSAILQLLGCQHVLVAVNKLDLLDFSEARYREIVAAYQKIADALGIAKFYPVPISALAGDNVVDLSERTPWYDGKPLLGLLEDLPLAQAQEDHRPTIFPVQRVLRQDGSKADDFRGYQGRIEQGQLRVGDRLRIEPQGQVGTVQAIYGLNGEQSVAGNGENITLTLVEDIDLSRGEVLVAEADGPVAERNLYAALCWLDALPLNPARRYLLKQTSNTVIAKSRGVDFLLDPNSLLQSKADAPVMKTNDIGRVRLIVQQPIVSTTYAQNRKTGAFILMDESSNQTVAAGMIVASDDPDGAGWTI